MIQMPSTETINALKDLIGKIIELISNHNFVTVALICIVAFVVYTAVRPVMDVPAKLESIIARLDQCVGNRVAWHRTTTP